jgi:hypothetical protein
VRKWLLLAALIFPVSGNAQTVNFKVQLDYDNTGCTTGNNCSADVFRAVCPGADAANCPQFVANSSSFTSLNSTVTTTQTVTASNTHFISIDAGAAPNNLAYSTLYVYAVRNAFLADPSHPGGTAQVNVATPAGIHTAILNWSSAACRTSSPCTLQVYRATCTSPTTCPSYPGSAWTALSMVTGLTSTDSAQGTSWQYQDNGSALAGSTTFAWVATCSYQGSSTSSPASTMWVGTTGVGKTVIIKKEIK